jgi:UDP-N-acetylmuramyl pentapeptide phosphotransferase/UDP-N-acetylglucosamine-1-phosphate transferase
MYKIISVIKFIFSNFDYGTFEIRIERGGMWYSKFNSVMTALLVGIFVSDINIWYKILSAVVTFFIIYFLGTLDDILKLFRKKQIKITQENPMIMEMLGEVKFIKNEIIKKNNL